VRSVILLTTPKVPPPPPFSAQKEVGICTNIGYSDLAVCRHYLSFEQTARGGSIVLRVTSEASALNQAAEAYREASTALNVSTSLGGDCVVRLDPRNEVRHTFGYCKDQDPQCDHKAA
jgi:hypothetical protein